MSSMFIKNKSPLIFSWRNIYPVHKNLCANSKINWLQWIRNNTSWLDCYLYLCQLRIFILSILEQTSGLNKAIVRAVKIPFTFHKNILLINQAQGYKEYTWNKAFCIHEPVLWPSVLNTDVALEKKKTKNHQ